MKLYSLMIWWICYIFCLLRIDLRYISYSSFLQMLFAMIAPLSAISSGKTSNDTQQKFGSRNQHEDDISEYTILDGTHLSLCFAFVHPWFRSCVWRALTFSMFMIWTGAVVAIKDMHQHMYFAVESLENMYRLGGAIHYSLVGERALFRVCNLTPIIKWVSRHAFITR